MENIIFSEDRIIRRRRREFPAKMLSWRRRAACTHLGFAVCSHSAKSWAKASYYVKAKKKNEMIIMPRGPFAWSLVVYLFGYFATGHTNFHRNLDTFSRHRHQHRLVCFGAFVTPSTTTIATAFQQRQTASTTSFTASTEKRRTILSFVPQRMEEDPRSSTISTKLRLSSKNTNNNNNEKIISSFLSSAFKTTIEVGDTIVCKRSIPNLGIIENSSHIITSIYLQYFDEEIQQIVKVPLSNLPLDGDYDKIVTMEDHHQQQQQQKQKLQDTNNRRRNKNSKVYMTLSVNQSNDSRQENSADVIVTPEEVGLISLQNELGNAAWLAVPGLFWVGLATSFYYTYHERTGGSLEDAFWGR